MNCRSCGAGGMSAAGCGVCGAPGSGLASRAPAQGVATSSARVDEKPGAGWQADPDHGVARAKAYVGVARAVRLRTEPSRDKGPTWQILNFRLDRFSDDGRPLQSIPVELRRLHLHGSVSDGETVEVRGAWHQGKLLEVKRIQNISTGSPVYGKGKPHPAVKILAIVLLLAVVISLMAALILGVYRRGEAIQGGTIFARLPATVSVVLTTTTRPHGSACVTLGRRDRTRRAPRGAAEDAAVCSHRHSAQDSFHSEVSSE